MSGAVMLLMAATVGITYGWTPDGGDGVKYIIQIPPEKMEQVARSGEISSRVPVEIRGHVSEVVIRVGDGNVPRVTPGRLSSHDHPASRSFAAGQSNPLAAADQVPIPIPSMGDPMDLRPIRSSRAAPTAMMKPAPQSGGMNMPEGLGTGYANASPPSTGYSSAGLGQAARDAADHVAQQFNATTDSARQQIQQNIHASAGRMGDAANSQMQSLANSARDAAGGLLYGPAPPPPSTADDPRTRLTQQGTSPARPSTTPYTGNANARTDYDRAPDNAASTSSANHQTPPSFASSPPSTNAPSSPSSATYPRPVSTPPLNATTSDEDWYALQNKSQQRPPAAQQRAPAPHANSPGSFAGGNFAQFPEGLQPGSNSFVDRSSQTKAPSDYAASSDYAGSGDNAASSGYANSRDRDDARRNSSSQSELTYDSHLSSAQAAALPKNGYSYDAEGYPVDRQGYRLDRYGRRVDRQGNLLASAGAAEQSGANASDSGRNTASDRVNAGGTGYPNTRPPQNVSTPPIMQPPRDRIAESGPRADSYSPDPDRPFAGANGSNTRRPAATHWNDERSRPSEDAMTSASDGPPRPSRFIEEEPTSLGGSGEPAATVEPVAAQPIFNALLLLSVVGNVYLLFWLKNLRLQFRDMVAAKRASAAGGSFATGV